MAASQGVSAEADHTFSARDFCNIGSIPYSPVNVDLLTQRMSPKSNLSQTNGGVPAAVPD